MADELNKPSRDKRLSLDDLKLENVSIDLDVDQVPIVDFEQEIMQDFDESDLLSEEEGITDLNQNNLETLAGPQVVVDVGAGFLKNIATDLSQEEIYSCFHEDLIHDFHQNLCQKPCFEDFVFQKVLAELGRFIFQKSF